MTWGQLITLIVACATINVLITLGAYYALKSMINAVWCDIEDMEKDVKRVRKKVNKKNVSD